MKYSFLLMILICLSFSSLVFAESEEGFVTIFDGKTYKGWKAATENPTTWKIENGAFVAHGERSHLYYVGDAKPFKNFEFKADVMTEPGSNGGIYFHTKYQEVGWPKNGFETQVNVSHGDWKKTGSLYDVVNLASTSAKDNEWWTQTIIVKDNKVTLKINDQIAFEYTEPAGAQAGKDFTRKLAEGTFALQAHDPKSVVRYKNIRVKRLISPESEVFAAIDLNKDGSITKDELKNSIIKWYADGDTLLSKFPTPLVPPPAGQSTRQAPACGGRANLPAVGRNACAADVTEMMTALPDVSPAKPAKARKVLVLGNAQTFVHSSIPLAARTIEALGTKTGAWTTTITYDPADINTKNLEQYDAIFLASTTGCFLDALPGEPPASKAERDARRAALLAFVRSGKGLAGIHAAADSYRAPCPNDEQALAITDGRKEGGAPTFGSRLSALITRWSDTNLDGKVTAAEIALLEELLFERLDPLKTGKVGEEDFSARFMALTRAGALGPDTVRGSWPEFNKMIGGFFKWHWNDPQLVTTKIDDPKSPLTAMFKGQSFDINDETYTFAMDTWSRDNIHVLTSVDYSKMSEEDKMKEASPRADHDYGLSWIRREGKGRVFYVAHGHSERVYKIRPMLEHILAGMQYVLGDLKADDTPR